MPRIYPPEQKAAALELLERNGGNIPMTALQTGVPERTLRTWRHESWVAAQFARLSSSPAAAAAVTPPRQPPTVSPLERQPNDDFAALDYMRRQILDELLSLSEGMRGSFALATPYQRALVITQLLDRLMKLDEHLKPYRPKPITTYHVVGSEGQEPDGDEPDITGTASETGGDSEL